MSDNLATELNDITIDISTETIDPIDIVVNIDVPPYKTSQLVNDGEDGSSPYITEAEASEKIEDYVQEVTEPIIEHIDTIDNDIVTINGELDDLDTIVSGINDEVETISGTLSTYGDIVTHNVNEFATSSQGEKADTALQPNDNITELTNNAGYITGINSSDVTTALGYTPYNSTNPEGYISGINSSDVTSALGYTPYNSTNPNNYQTNVIETIKVNNVAQTITSKAVNITVPTQALDIGAVPTSRTINGKALTTDITLNSSDVGALSSSTTINDLTTTAQQNALNSGATATNIGQIATNTNNITTINSKIPAQATASNQLADKEFVNSSIATNTANFIGTFANIQSLESYSGTVTNNDYAFVVNHVVTDNGNDWSSFNSLNSYNKAFLTNFDYAWVINGSNFDLYRFDIVAQEWVLRASNIAKTDVSLNTAYNRYKASVSGSTVTWDYEYTLNNSSFTAAQWTAINSGITSGDVALIQTALQSGDNISELVNDSGYITGITSSDVTTALGYTPYNSTNPAGYTSNIGTVTSVNNVQPVSGNVTISIPTNTSDLTNDSGFLTSSDLTNYVTTNTDQNITGTKTFVGQKKIAFKQSGNSDKLGFTLYNNSGTEKGYLEYNPSNSVDGVPLMTLGNYASAAAGLTHVGFRKYSSISGANGAYNLLTPLISDAKTPFNLTTTYTNFYLPLGFKNGNTTVTTAKTGVADLSSLFTDYALASSIPTKVSDLTNDSGYITGITSSDVTSALGYTPENVSNKTTTIDSNSTDTQYPSAKSVYNNLTTKADTHLSNLDITGENRLHSLKGYLESGQSYTDTTLYNDVYYYNHSTFDVSKFTVVGTPTITTDGIASEFKGSGGKYLYTPISIKSSNIKITGSFRTPNTHPINQSKYVCSLVEHRNTSSDSVAMLSFGVTQHTGVPVLSIKDDGASYSLVPVISTRYDDNEYHTFEILSKNGVITLYIDKTFVGQISHTLTTNFIDNIHYIEFGVCTYPYGQLLPGSIDLKQFSIYVDGKPVFNGNKTGIDTIKSADYTTVGTPTISADGIASGFSSSDYLTKITTISLDKTTYFELDVTFKTPSSWTKNGRFWAYGAKLAFGHSAIGKLSGAFISSAINQDSIRILDTNTIYEAKYIYDATGFYVKFKKANETTWTSSTPATVTSTETQTLQGAIGNAYTDTTAYYTGSIDLNSIKFYVNGNLVYQPCLLIPYNESSTGSKIVDVAYRDRVIDVYEQYGSANYYTIDEVNQNATLPMGEIYGFIEKTNETINNYLPLTGGTLTGSLFFQGASNKNLGVKLTDSGTNADIGWEYSTTAGAGIALRSTSWSSASEQGAFIIYARSSSGTPKLVGTPAGSLKWNNQEVLRANSTLDATKLSGTIPTACYSNNAVTNTLNNTAKAYLTGSTTATTNTGGQVFDDGVYITTTAGKLNATKLSVGNENATMQYNSTTEAIEFVFP